MPKSFNGCGTTYYGQRDFRADGSHITTNFICLLFLPLLPIHSVRVIPDSANSAMPFSTSHYMVLEKRWPNPIQVLLVYLSAAAVIAQCVLFFLYVDPYLKSLAPWLARGWVEYLILCCTLFPLLLVPRWFRDQAKKRVRSEIINPNDSTPIA